MSQQILDELVASAIGLLLLSGVALYLYCFFDIQKRKTRYLSEKNVWLNILWQWPVVGSLIYLSRRKKYWEDHS